MAGTRFTLSVVNTGSFILLDVAAGGMLATTWAASYECTGPAREVLVVRDAPAPEPATGEIRMRSPRRGRPRRGQAALRRRRAGNRRAARGPGDDGAGVVDAVAPGVDRRADDRTASTDATAQAARAAGAEHLVDSGERDAPRRSSRSRAGPTV